MKPSFENIDDFFEFNGLWDIKSKCGIKICKNNGKFVVIVSELYLDNPGTSVTQAVNILPQQICSKYNIPFDQLIYIEHNPDMNSKLSFYDEEFFLVNFDLVDGNLLNPKYKQLSGNDIKSFLNQ